MSRIDDDDIRRVREATDLVQLIGEHVILKQKGRLFWGCCPFHNEKTPSFKVDPATQLWHCFGCGKGGDAFKYMMEHEKLEFPEAVRMLADRAHVEIKETNGPGMSRNERQRLMDACKKTEEFYHTQLMRNRSSAAGSARQYLHGRGFGSEPSNKWNLGYAPGRGQLVSFLQREGFTRDELVKANLAYANESGRLNDRFYNRVMFPVHDLQGNTIAFGGRVIGKGEPKYLNTSETPVFHKSSNMFGIDKAKSSIVSQGEAVVVEGYTDVIALHEAGITNVVATLGTALTAQHVKLLSRFASSIIYLFDGDAAGQKAALRASEFIDWNSAVESRRNPIELKVAVIPDAMDPAEYVAAQGAQGMRQVLSAAEPLLRFAITRKLGAYDLSKPELKGRALQEALSVLLPLRGSVTATDYVNLIADRLGLDYSDVLQVFGEMKAPVAARHEEDEAVSEQEMRPEKAAVAKVVAADMRFVQMERELVSLAVSDGNVVKELGKELLCINWTDRPCENMAGALIALEGEATPAVAFSACADACSDAPQILAQAMSEVEPGPASLKQARLLADSLMERDLERSIKAARARLRDEKTMSPQEVDALFEETVGMQKQLAELRKRLN